MPPKVRKLIKQLKDAGFVDRGGRAVIETSFTQR
jgi:hypothetical protein